MKVVWGWEGSPLLSPDHSCSCVGLFERSGYPRGSHTPSQQQPTCSKISRSPRSSSGCTHWVEEPALGRPCPAESLRTRLQCKQGSQLKHEWLGAITYRWLEPVSADGRRGATLALLQAVNDIIVGDKAPLSTPLRGAGRPGQRLSALPHQDTVVHFTREPMAFGGRKCGGKPRFLSRQLSPKGTPQSSPKQQEVVGAVLPQPCLLEGVHIAWLLWEASPMLSW